VIVSIVLNLPTVGPLLLQSLQSQDMFLAAGIVMIISALTIIGIILLIVWHCTRGTPGPNRFGADPLAAGS
jgi:peptide/nickel transport system permease protein